MLIRYPSFSTHVCVEARNDTVFKQDGGSASSSVCVCVSLALARARALSLSLCVSLSLSLSRSLSLCLSLSLSVSVCVCLSPPSPLPPSADMRVTLILLSFKVPWRTEPASGRGKSIAQEYDHNGHVHDVDPLLDLEIESAEFASFVSGGYSAGLY